MARLGVLPTRRIRPGVWVAILVYGAAMWTLAVLVAYEVYKAL